MSAPSGAGAPPPSGVVCNSALSFVASAQPLQQIENVQQTPQETSSGETSQTDKIIPPGLKDLCDACSKLYPDQPNPLQVTTRLKYWLGGEDPLDYISMYWHPGNPEQNIPSHWHYISFGLSDLHGDGRVHPPSGRESGYGFELSMRASAPRPAPAPLWPAHLLQATARYVFTTGNKFCAGDHISWHRALDPGGRSTRIRHLLVAKDPALDTCHTRHGSVEFLQLVGCTSRELRAAQRGSGFEVLKLMKEDSNCGGPFLVTNSLRRASVPGCRRPLAAAQAGLAGVSCALSWLPLQPDKKAEEASSSSSSSPLEAGLEEQIKDTLRRGLSAMSTQSTGKGQTVGHMSTDSFEMSSIERALPHITDTASSWREEQVQYLDGVHVFMNAEGASLLPLAIQGRIKHGAHFTWRCGGCALTVLTGSVAGAFATSARPIAARGDWLQVVLSKEDADELSRQVSSFSSLCQSHSESESEREDVVPPPTLPVVVTAGGFTLTVVY